MFKRLYKESALLPPVSLALMNNLEEFGRNPLLSFFLFGHCTLDMVWIWNARKLRYPSAFAYYAVKRSVVNRAGLTQ